MATRPKAETTALNRLFSGKKAKWLPLYRRLAARLSQKCDVDFDLLKTSVSMGSAGKLKITIDGLEIGLALPKGGIRSPRLLPCESRSKTTRKKITHRVLVAKASEIDEELLSWVKAAFHQTRPSRKPA